MKRVPQKTIVVIYRVMYTMYTEHYEYTLRTEAVGYLNGFGVCKLASCTSSIRLHKELSTVRHIRIIL